MSTNSFSKMKWCFEVVKLNKTGEEINREQKEAEYFADDCGNGVELEMVYIPGGNFIMGSPDTEEKSSWSKGQEIPQHKVSVQAFFLGKFPVTQKQWRAIASLPIINQEMESDPSHFQGEDLPVETVSWDDAVEFCARLSELTAKEYRLPTEAEWEYAIRGGTTTPFHFGETISTEFANYNGKYTYGEGVKGEYTEQTTPVGYFKVANAFGLSDMHGNVWEWCEDDWHSHYEGAPNDGTAWLSGLSNEKIIRGGSCGNYPVNCRCARRYSYARANRNNYIGFRVVYVASKIT